MYANSKIFQKNKAIFLLLFKVSVHKHLLYEDHKKNYWREKLRAPTHMVLEQTLRAKVSSRLV